MVSNSKKVFNFLKTIPKGKVVTYGQISKKLGINSARAVGQILHRNDQPDEYPCHRVVFANGEVSSGFAFGGKEEHKARLIVEGVEFDGFKVKLEQHLLEL